MLDSERPDFRFDPNARRIRITDEAIIENLRQFAATIGNRPFRMREYDAWDGRLVAAGTILGRIGRWRTALAKAGIRGGRSKKYTPEELITNLEAVWRTVGRPPGNDILAARGQIGYGAYIRVYGSVRNACELLAAYHAGRITREKLLRVIPENRKPEKHKRAPIAPALRWQVLKRDRYRCVLCGRNPAADETVQLHIDHITPVSRGGDNRVENLRTLCRECNEGKSDELPTAIPSEPRP